MRFSRLVFVAAFVFAFGALTGCGQNALTPDSPDESTQETGALTGTRLRLMTGNLSSGNDQSYTPGVGGRIFAGCHPDIVMIQEFNYGTNSAADIRSFIDANFGTSFSYARGPATQIPNGVISRYPIIASGDWTDPSVSNRDFTWAHIDLPGTPDAWVVSVHLLTSGAGNRQTETAALSKLLQANVPAGDYIIIGGDFNVGSRTEASLNNLSGQVVISSTNFPVDSKGNGNTNASRNKPYDQVLVSSGLAALATPTVIGSQTFTNGFVADTRVFSPMSDLSPALASDSAAPSMQHMGVVRDFLLPSVTPPSASVQVLSPNGGETFTIGSTQTVQWQSSNVGSVNVSYSGDGVSFTTLATNVTGTSFSWSVSQVATSKAVIKVTDSSNASTFDVSDAAFTVQTAPPPASVQVVSPNGGESFAAGSTQTIRWSAVGLTTVDVAYAADGTVFTRVASAVDAAAGSLSWVVPNVATTAARIRISDSATATVVDSSDAAFSVTVSATPAQVIINEVLANEPGSDTAGEFVELVNVGGTAADLSGWSLSDASTVRHTFAAGTSLAAGATLVVFGKLSAAPAGLSAVGATTGTLGLSNSGDSVKLANGSTVVDSVTYAASLASVDGVSMNRSPDRSPGASLVLHTSLSTKPSSPGTAP